ncbi:DUF6717 family protein [Chitinophaga sp. GbtcB8]|uniref:DUF6717 family protein n=1 Tax=Chitinophaga sp. GbtcB8 TaxID=2824753 RepID=UPI001C30C2BB|nr:DUF6717 family protein [Chitinophaga sp. GbtcB8]
MRLFNFIFKNEKWYIDLPQYLALGGKESDLEMVAGADVMLDLYSQHKSSVSLFIDTVPFQNSDALYLTEICNKEDGGGAFYFMPFYQQKKIDQSVWLCDVLIFVFNAIPPIIYCANSKY